MILLIQQNLESNVTNFVLDFIAEPGKPQERLFSLKNEYRIISLNIEKNNKY